eukprot:c13513_g1_i1 orf=122-763(+)
MAAPVKIKVDVWSDIACPWCYVGKARLDKAVQKLESEFHAPPVQVSVNWHPYMIDVRTNTAGEEYLAYNKRRWGSDSWTLSLRRAGARDGLQFKDWKWWPNTLNAHRLVFLAQRHGSGSEAVHKLFQMVYEEGMNISDLEVVCSAAEGMELPGARQFLTSDQGKKEVVEEDKAAKSEFGIDSVPYFIVDNRYTFSGAQDVSTIESALRKAINF